VQADSSSTRKVAGYHIPPAAGRAIIPWSKAVAFLTHRPSGPRHGVVHRPVAWVETARYLQRLLLLRPRRRVEALTGSVESVNDWPQSLGFANRQSKAPSLGEILATGLGLD
jgi:hypothetical protein